MKYYLSILASVYLAVVLLLCILFWFAFYPDTGGDPVILIAGFFGTSWFFIVGGLLLFFLGNTIYDIQIQGSKVVIKALRGTYSISPSDVTAFKRRRPEGWIRLYIKYGGKVKKLYYQPRFSSPKYVTPSAEELKRIFPFAQTH